jgi:hypothetical protein
MHRQVGGCAEDPAPQRRHAAGYRLIAERVAAILQKSGAI